MTGITLRIEGSPPAKANAYRIVQVRGRPALTKTRQTRDFEEQVTLQAASLMACLGIRPPLFATAVRLVIMYHQRGHRRRDIDNLVKAIADALTASGIWQDDRQIDTLIVQRRYDATETEWTDILIYAEP